MQRDDPVGFRELVDHRLELASLLGGNHSKGVGEGEMGFRVGVENRYAETVLCGWREDHRKLLIPKTPKSGR